MKQEREAGVRAFEQGHRPAWPVNAATLLVIGLDGGRVQMREKTGENGSRRRADKIGTLTTHLPGDGTKEWSTQAAGDDLATMQSTDGFGKMVAVEAERRGLSRCTMTLTIGDGGNWIDPLIDRVCLYDRRIIDYYHVVEHLYQAAGAAMGKGSPASTPLAEELKDHLWNGRVDAVIQNGWPIGWGMTEAVVKQFNQRVTGTEQFRSEGGVEDILALPALRLSQDDRWNRYWNTRAPYSKAA